MRRSDSKASVEREEQRVASEIGRSARRKLEGRAQERRTAWFGLGMFGLVGWAVAVPTLLGVLLGLWLDERWPQDRLSWTLTLLFLGVILGCLNAWYWVAQESRRE